MNRNNPDKQQIPGENEIVERARGIRLLALDVDGVLTDGCLYFSNSGDETKTFSTLDGHGIKLLQQFGIHVALITGRTSEIVVRRAANLGIEHVVQGREDKIVALDSLLDELQLGYEDTAYIGDDWPDLACIRRVRFGITVPDAHPELPRHAFMVTRCRGGHGAVREVCDWILRANGLYEKALESYL